MCVFVLVFVFAFVCTCLSVLVCACVCVHSYIHTHIRTHIHSYTHTYPYKEDKDRRGGRKDETYYAAAAARGVGAGREVDAGVRSYWEGELISLGAGSGRGGREEGGLGGRGGKVSLKLAVQPRQLKAAQARCATGDVWMCLMAACMPLAIRRLPLAVWLLTPGSMGLQVTSGSCRQTRPYAPAKGVAASCWWRRARASCHRSASLHCKCRGCRGWRGRRDCRGRQDTARRQRAEGRGKRR